MARFIATLVLALPLASGLNGCGATPHQQYTYWCTPLPAVEAARPLDADQLESTEGPRHLVLDFTPTEKVARIIVYDGSYIFGGYAIDQNMLFLSFTGQGENLPSGTWSVGQDGNQVILRDSPWRFTRVSGCPKAP